MKLIEIINNTAQTIGTNDPLLFGSISRRIGCFTDYSAPGTTVTLRECGYYEITLKVNATATVAAQAMEITLFLDGVAQPETMATSVGTAVGDTETLNTHKKIRIFAADNTTVSVINTGAADTTYTGMVLDIKKVG